MPRKGHSEEKSEEKIVCALSQVERGAKVGDACREMGVAQTAGWQLGSDQLPE